MDILGAQNLPSGRGDPLRDWDDPLDAPGQRQGQLPSSVWTRQRAVKRRKSKGSVGTTDEGKGKEREVERGRLGKAEDEGHRVARG